MTFGLRRIIHPCRPWDRPKAPESVVLNVHSWPSIYGVRCRRTSLDPEGSVPTFQHNWPIAGGPIRLGIGNPPSHRPLYSICWKPFFPTGPTQKQCIGIENTLRKHVDIACRVTLVSLQSPFNVKGASLKW